MSATRACPHCGHAVQAGQTYCGECGEALPAVSPPTNEPQAVLAGPEIAGRMCPRCGVAIAPNAPTVQCRSCGTPHHQECFAADGGCAVVGCPGNPRTQVQPQSAPVAMYPAYLPPPPPSSGTNPWLITGAVIGGVVTIGLIVLVVLLAGGSGSTSTTTHQAAAVPIHPISSSAGNSGSGAGSSSGSGSARGLVSSPTTNSTPQAPPPLGAPGVTGTDGQGYNVGPGCSDNPSSSLPGCADSPSAPNGDPEATCPGGITVDSQTTSCGLAENVKAAYHSDGLVVALSPERRRSYAFTCQTGGAGTTHMTICHGQAGSATLYLRW